MGTIKRILMIIVAFALIGAAVYLAWQWKKSQSTHSSSATPSAWTDVASQSENTFTPSTDVLNGNLDNIADPAAWIIYENQELGFSINVPKKVLGIDKCKKTKFEAPIVEVEDPNTSAVFIVPEYYYDNYAPVAEQTQTNPGITFIEDDPINTADPNLSDTNSDGVFDCRKNIYNLPLVKEEIMGAAGEKDRMPLVGNPYAGISLRLVNISNTAALNEFIQKVFGSGCVLSKKEEWANQTGTYRLEIKKSGDKDSRGNELACATDTVSDILYNPAKNKLAYAYFPAAGMLFSAESKSFDKEMIASFRFE